MIGWLIEGLNVLFVFSLAMVTLWLFFQNLRFDKVRRPSPKQRAELLVEVCRDGVPYLKVPLERSHYLIGRGPECDIPLRGKGIPFQVGKISERHGNYIFENLNDLSITVNGRPVGRETKSVFLGDEINAYRYSLKIKERFPVTFPLSSLRGRR